MSNEKTIKAAVLLSFRKNRITVSKKVLQAIGGPKFILFLVSPEERTLAIMSSDETERRAHRIRLTQHRRFELYSKRLLKTLLKLCGDWRENYSYSLDGEIVNSAGVIKFHIDNAVLVSKVED